MKQLMHRGISRRKAAIENNIVPVSLQPAEETGNCVSRVLGGMGYLHESHHLPWIEQFPFITCDEDVTFSGGRLLD